MSNRGALPFCDLSADPGGTRRVLVPLLAAESVWIAWEVGPGIRVAGTSADGASLRAAPIANLHQGHALIAVDAVESHHGPLPINARTIKPAATLVELEGNHLDFTVEGREGAASRLAIVFANPVLYEAVSGCPAPGPTFSDDSYGGWRLP